MARVRLALPEKFSFSTQIQIRITDINYGNHLGNDAVLSLLHEARMQYLKSLGYTELEFAAVSLIMSDVMIEFRAEAFYGDVLEIQVTAGEIGRFGFDLFYKVTRPLDALIVAKAKTGMVCFDYSTRKICELPNEALVKLQNK